MSFWELMLIAVGLSADAFAIAISAGLTMQKATLKKASVVGLYFGMFQAVMPVIGYFLATWFADKITAYDHWIAFGLLSIIGGKMIVGAFVKKGCKDRACPAEVCTDRKCPGRPEEKEFSLSPKKMLPLAVATSIDALAVGVSFAFLKIKIVPAAVSIGVTTFVLSMAGLKIGNVFGGKLKSKAALIGGVILVLIGVKILLEHLGVIGF